MLTPKERSSHHFYLLILSKKQLQRIDHKIPQCKKLDALLYLVGQKFQLHHKTTSFPLSGGLVSFLRSIACFLVSWSLSSS